MRDQSVLERILNGDEEPKDLPLALLQDITNDFCEENKIGQGGFGEVYKTRIAEAGSDDFKLVNVRERLLCFEYISNGSLDKHITDELRGLQWEKRYDIITGICNGLRHLEEKEIIHMDLKPANILLDDHMVPKITDFGLSRPNENSHTMGPRFGTRGYVAPEYDNAGKTSVKSDIYSFGAIIIELVTGFMGIPDKNNVLRRWRHRWSKSPTLLQYQQLTRCMEIAVRCRQQEPEARPSIMDIINYLSKSESTDVHTDQIQIHWLANHKPSRPSQQYTTRPGKGIVPPGCNEHLVQITVQAQRQDRAPQVTQNGDKFIIQSTKVSNLRDEDITEHIFHEEAGKMVDEVNLMVKYEPVSRQDPSLPAEAVSLMDINSSIYKDGVQGQCHKELDRRDFHLPEEFSQSQPTNMTYLLRVSDRAVDVTRGAMGSLLHKLGELIKEDFNLEASVKKDVQSLSGELVTMQLVLRKVSEVQRGNLDDLVKRWASNVREMSYDLEDFVDGFLVQSQPESSTSGFRELTHEICFHLEKGKSHHTIGNLIKDKSKQVQDAAKKCKEYKVDNVVPNASAKAAIDELRILAMYEDKEQLVGINRPRDELIRLFEEDGDVSKENLKIVSIVGLGGLGKTTLAKAVYDELKAQYHLKTFVLVGQNPDVKKVLGNILRKLVRNFNVENLEAEDLIEELQELLEDKRYFIVIDDIWDSTAWGRIAYAFPRNSCGSRVITTTRIERVARDCCKVECKNVYRMKPLGEVDSRTLFLRRTFGSEKDCPDTHRKEEILVDILKKCGGMPLAINSIASLLAGEPESTWEYVWKSLGALTEGDNLENMKQILDLSYIHLPDHLKACLLYICMYPEDREIDKTELLRKWVAEGFVHVSTNGLLDAVDVAEKYFKELINMCMIQPWRISYNNEVLSCRVHDIILDMMRSKSSKENFIHVIDGSKVEMGEIRRASVHYNDKKDTTILETINKGSLSHVRSVLLCRSSLLPYFLDFKYVRVLHLEHKYSLNNYLDLTGISGLFLLRCELKLPNKIEELQQLETIDIRVGKLREYPSDIVSLPQLSHLSSMGTMLPDGIDRLKSLCTLQGVDMFKSSVENIKGLSKLTNLRELGISWNGSSESVEESTMDALDSSIRKLSANLRIFTFKGGFAYKPDVPGWITRPPFHRDSHLRELNLGGCRFQRCPEWIGELHGLYKLGIVVREVADGVSIVARLPSLAHFYLIVSGMGEEEKEESVVIPGTGSGAFRALKQMLFNCPKVSLNFEAGAMPKLEKLSLRFRHNMAPQFLPVGIQHLPAGTLKQIWLHVYSNQTQNKTSVRHLLEGAFKQHHPSADITVDFI
uniref:Disease resistance protein RPP13 n=1 Tax=Aegilops tauschii TaxID=37682 RepID=N1QU93_AEGTA